MMLFAGAGKSGCALSLPQMFHHLIIVMANHKSLLHTNKYLANKQTRERLLVAHAAASARIEGIPNAMRLAKRASSTGKSRRMAKRS